MIVWHSSRPFEAPGTDHSDMAQYDFDMPTMTMNDQASHPSTLENNIAQAPLHNTSDAMGILAQLSNEFDPHKATTARSRHSTSDHAGMKRNSTANGEIVLDYQPLRDGLITKETILELVRR